MRILHLRTPGIGTSTPQPPGSKPGQTSPAGRDRQQVSVLARGFTAFANGVAHLAGRPISFVLCCVIILGWAISGPIFHYSDTWQLIINTGTTIITFLMVFLIQNTQNRDGAAVQAKLDELIRAVEGARNHFIGIEHLTEEQLEAIRSVCEREAEKAEEDLLSTMELENDSAARHPAGRQSPGAAAPERD